MSAFLRRSAMALAFVLASIGLTRSARAQSAPAHAGPIAVASPVPVDLASVMPLVDRGVVVEVHRLSEGERSSTESILRVHAPRAEVFAALSDPSHFADFVPWVVRSTELSRRNGRSAHRLSLRVASFDIDAMLTMRTIGTHAIETTLRHDEIGAGVARWDLYDDGPDDTIVRMRVQVSFVPDSFLVRMAMGVSNETYLFGGIAASYSLSLHFKLGIERRRGVTVAVRTPVVDASVPPPDGAWMDIARHSQLIAVGLDAHGNAVQEFVLNATTVPVPPLRARMTNMSDRSRYLPWFGNIRETTRTTEQLTFRTRLGAPFDGSQGEYRMDIGAPSARVLAVSGVSGAFTGEHERWDFVRRDITFIASTTTPMNRHFSATHRVLLAGDPLVGEGFSLAWHAYMHRWMFAGVV